MVIPKGLTEAQVLESIETVVTLLAPSFVFGYHDLEDMKQQGREWAINLLNKGTYDSSRPLNGYLYTSLFRLYINFQRDHLFRNEPPCRDCHKGNFCSEKFPGVPCKSHTNWIRRNSAKSSLMRPNGLDTAPEKAEPMDVVDEIEKREAEHLIDVHLPFELREDYLRMKAGVSVSKVQREIVLDEVRRILGCQNEDD